MKPILVIVDGSNFYHGCKYLAPKVHLTNFNYRKLIEKVVGKGDLKICYCVGEIRKERNNKKSEQLYSLQQSLFYTLEKQDITIYKGFMLKSDGKYHEKGVDVRMAVEIIKGSFRDEYDQCFLFSSDTDIIPAILEAKKQHKEIVYVGFEKRLSRAMSNNCSKTKVMTAKEIADCSY